MKYKKQLQNKEARIKNWEINLAKDSGYRKPGSNKK